MPIERKERLIRVLQLLESTDKKSPMNANQMMEQLENVYAIKGVDRRALYRDIDMLTYCGYPITQCYDKRNGWYMEKHVFDDWEIKIMMDAVMQAKCVSAHEAASIRDKLLSLTSSRGRSRFSHMMRPVADSSYVTESVGTYIEMMLEALFLHRKIEFQYTEITNDMKKVLRREGKVYHLNLYTIYWSNDNYYLIGSHDNHPGITHYRLDRVVNLKISEEPAIDAKEKIGPNPELYIQNYIQESVNHFSGELVRIKVEYTPDPVTNAILYDFAGKEIKVKKLENGKYTASFTKMKSVTLTAWFLQYATRFKVLKPQELVDDIQNELKTAINQYTN